MKLRMASPLDGENLLSIYRPYIGTTITFEYECPSVAEFQSRNAHTLSVYPYLLAEEEGQVLGYAYAHRLAQRAAYNWSAELSIYLREDTRYGGLGRNLYGALMDLIALQGVRTAYALITSPNPASQRFHEKLGFQLSGIQHNAGYKNGRWLGVAVYEKQVGPYGPEPGPVIPVGQLSQNEINQILDRYSG